MNIKASHDLPNSPNPNHALLSDSQPDTALPHFQGIKEDTQTKRTSLVYLPLNGRFRTIRG